MQDIFWAVLLSVLSQILDKAKGNQLPLSISNQLRDPGSISSTLNYFSWDSEDLKFALNEINWVLDDILLKD